MDSYPTKAAQKADLDKLNKEYETIRQADFDAFLERCRYEYAQGGERPELWDEMMRAEGTATDLPYYLHQYNAKRCGDWWECVSRKERAAELVELRAAVKALPIVPQSKPADPFVEAEKLATKAMKDDGFRTMDVQAQCVGCGNWQGTQWMRTDWYWKGRRTAFSMVAGEVGEQHEAWNAAGRPNMADWTAQEIRDFHVKHQGAIEARLNADTAA